MRSLKAFAESMRERAEVVETVGSRLAVIGTAAAVEHAVYITPVDTSEHLSNWQVNLTSPAADALPPYVAGERGSTRGISASEAIQAANEELRFKKPGQVIYISNLGPAIKRLDEGSSSQFPGGFVPRMMVAFRAAIDEARPNIFKGK